MLVSKGNRKLGTDTLIFNMTSATDCPSRALGLCKLPGKCYAMKAERMYKAVLPYRRRQAAYWKAADPIQVANDLRALIKPAIKYIRVSEAGDFTEQNDVTKWIIIANLLLDTGIVIYGYTARADLNFEGLPSNLVINGSSFMVSNMFSPVPAADLNTYPVTCPGNCRICNKCKEANGLDIKVALH